MLAIELGVILLILGITTGYYFLVIKPREDSARESVQQAEFNPYAPTDYYAPMVEEILATNPANDVRFAEFIRYGYLKESVNNNYEAIAFYEAAIEVAPDENAKKDVQYTIYVLAHRIGERETTERYKTALGEEWIRNKEQSFRREE